MTTVVEFSVDKTSFNMIVLLVSANFVKLLAKVMSNEGIFVEECAVDADITIVKDALLSIENSTTVVIGKDTDLLLLLCYHIKMTS